MRIENLKVEDLFATIDWCIKKYFPDNYDARCLYSACAIHTILVSCGVKAQIVGGNVGIFTVSIDGREALLQGFGGSDATQPSHYWVETSELILDPGAAYLPKSSQIKVVPMPMVAWRKTNPLPSYLQYQDKIRYAVDAEYMFAEDIATRISDFIELCKKRYTSRAAKKKLVTWLLTSPDSLNNAAKLGNKWAKCALHFQSMKSVPTIPV
ncbi:hypothetical protein KCM76_22220 [Zooshikella marina]|uniref:hypothetical protein n=1 Tax=Zooshikella ganghwensis TaxID=202772 RepID=UPI001BAEFD2E|nr:hypothetical protein [Zooshikella ganghwensis]MBU2708725.1 hypothetical protein [Zooshikella ganghwensis]